MHFGGTRLPPFRSPSRHFWQGCTPPPRNPEEEMTMRKLTTFFTLLTLAFVASTASAQSTGFTHTVEAYFMGANMTGTAGAGP